MRRGYFFLVLVVLLGCCGQAEARQLVDMFNRRLEVPEQIKSIYGTSPIATYLAYSLSPELVAGLNTLPLANEKPYLKKSYLDKPILGGWFGQGNVSNLEVLLRVKPDIILNCSWGPSATNEKIEKALAPLHIPVVYVFVEKLSDYPAAYRFLGRLFGLEERGEMLARYTERMLAEAAAVRNGQVGTRLRVYYAEGPKGLQTECDSSIHAQLIPLSGAVNVHHCTDKSNRGQVTVSMEQVLQYAPQIILTHDDEFYRTVRTDPRWSSIKAVQDGRVYKIPKEPFNWFDRPPSFMRLLGLKWLQGVLFQQPENAVLVVEIQNFYQAFLDVTLSASQAEQLLQP